MALTQGQRIGRICPVVQQQCLLARSCVLFDDPKKGSWEHDEKLRAWSCPKRGAFVYRDERTARTFQVHEHPEHARYQARQLQMGKLRSAVRRRAQIGMWETTAAAEGAAT
jgi:hypothetical protein